MIHVAMLVSKVAVQLLAIQIGEGCYHASVCDVVLLFVYTAGSVIAPRKMYQKPWIVL
jgi:hypothetical protein